MDHSTDAERCLRALDGLIAAAEAEVVRLSQLEHEAEAQLALLRLSPPELLWPEGVTLTVETTSRSPDTAAQPVREAPKWRRRVEPTPAEAVAEPEAAPPRPAAAPARSATAETAVVPVTALRRPKNLMEALS